MNSVHFLLLFVYVINLALAIAYFGNAIGLLNGLAAIFICFIGVLLTQKTGANIST